jgi:hypothetical protein
MFTSLLQWLDNTAMAETVRESVWIFPAMETIHVAAIAIVVGSIALLDLRLAGLVSRRRAISEVSAEMLPWTWTSFAIATLFGVLLFASQPIKYVGIAFFDAKILLILLAGMNMLVFEFMIAKNQAAWDRDPTPPTIVRIAGSLSLAFWVSVLVLGRLIGFI